MEEGLGPGVVAAVGELSQEEGELGLQSLVVVFFFFISGGLQQKSGRFWSQHTSVPLFSVRSLEVEMLERGIKCLVRWDLALVCSVDMTCCPGFPDCFPECSPWVLSFGVVIHHGLHVMSSVGRAQPG